MTVSEQTMRWLRFVSVTSIPLFKLDENELPCGVASGCLANIGGQKLILSVPPQVALLPQKYLVRRRRHRELVRTILVNAPTAQNSAKLMQYFASIAGKTRLITADTGAARESMW